MSLPSFPGRDNTPSREEVINQIISSIAMEELGLSHIINAEGEKLQYALGTIPGITGIGPLTIDELVTLNDSIHKTLDSTMLNQFFLKEKLVNALTSSVMQGPPGPTGATGAPGPAGASGMAATVSVAPAERVPFSMQPYVINEGTPSNSILKFGIPEGLPGEPGAQGATGPRGPIAATIPFSISSGYYQGITISCDQEGKPHAICFAGFGSNDYNSIHLEPGEWDNGTLTIGQSTPYPSSFVMPFSGTLKNIYVLLANREEMYLEAGVIMHPFACIAVSEGDSLEFTILGETITYTEPYADEDGSGIPKYSVRKGSKTGLNIEIPEGTLIGVFVGWSGEGVTYDMQLHISASGGLFIE